MKSTLRTLVSLNDDAAKCRSFKRTVATCMLMLIALFGIAQEKPGHCLKVKVRPTVDGHAVKGATITLYRGAYEEMVIDSTPKREAVLYLDRNDSYTIEVSAPGRIARRVTVNTAMPAAAPADLTHKCVMDVEMPAAQKLHNEYYLDFPVAIVRFDVETGRFGHIEDYTSTVRIKMEEESASDPVILTSMPLDGEEEMPVARVGE